MNRCIAILLTVTALSSVQGAATNRMDTAIRESRTDVRQATKALNTLRSRIEEQRAPLAATHRKLQRRVQDKRRRLDRLLEARQYGKEKRRQLEQDVAALEEECRFVLTALSEYRRSLETRTQPAALHAMRDALNAWDTALSEAEAFSRLPAAAEAILPLALAWNQLRIGGYRVPGSAVDHAGIEKHGTFSIFGPTAYFATTNGAAGIVLTRFGSLNPAYFEGHSTSQQSAIAALCAGKSAPVPLDPTLGDAVTIEAAGESFLEHLRKGGFVMVPLLGIGILAFALTVWKFIELRGMRQASTESLHGVLACLDRQAIDEARQTAQQLHPPLSTIIADGIAYRDAPREHLEEILHERILATVPRLERYLGTLAVFGAVAPLLGLLGTVTGMIHTFDLVTLFGTGEARLLSGGISEALITTKFGLAIAIPVLLVHAFLTRRVRTIIGALENTAARFVNALKIGAPTG